MAYFSPSITSKHKDPSGKNGESDPMLSLNWYHPHLTRHAADCMLIDNAPEGSYLLRASSDFQTDGSYVLSVKLSSSVQHVKIVTSEAGYRFGNSTFQNVESFRKHFELERPVIGGDSGVTVLLRFPYARFINEARVYTDVVHHAVTNMLDSSTESEEDTQSEGSLNEMPHQAISSKEGFMTKQGKIRKNWKCRWFVLRNNMLSYYKKKLSRRPIDRLDLSRALAVEFDNSKQKDGCFRIELPNRTYYMYAASPEDCHQWVELLRSKIPTSHPSS